MANYVCMYVIAYAVCIYTHRKSSRCWMKRKVCLSSIASHPLWLLESLMVTYSRRIGTCHTTNDFYKKRQGKRKYCMSSAMLEKEKALRCSFSNSVRSVRRDLKGFAIFYVDGDENSIAYYALINHIEL